MVTLRIPRSFRGPVRCVLSAAFLVTAGAVGAQTQTNQISSRFSAEAMTAAGTPVSYVKPTVLDENGKPLPVECNPKSGAVFPLGTTDVACTAPNNFSTTLTVTVADTRAPSTSRLSKPTASPQFTGATSCPEGTIFRACGWRLAGCIRR